MSKPKNITELTDIVAQEIENVLKDPRRVAQAECVINGAGKIAALIKVQLVYAALKGEEPDIEFLGETSGRPLKSTTRKISV